MMRARWRLLAGVLAVLALLALPGAAHAQAPAPPYRLSDDGAAGQLLASNNSTLAVKATRAGTEVVFEPAAQLPLPPGCSNAGGVTTCDSATLQTRLRLQADNLEVTVTGVVTTTLRLEGGDDVDSINVNGSIDNVELAPGGGSDSIAVGGAVGEIVLFGLDAGNDRYTITSTTATIGPTLELGDGDDVVSSAAPNLTLDGGAGGDTLIGPGALLGGSGSDVLKPTVTGQQADGGDDPFTSDSLSYELVNAGLTFTKPSATSVQITGDGIPKTGIERLAGTGGDDLMTGHGGFDALAGGDGNDTIVGSGGSDALDGGPGDNLVSYAGAATSVAVDLAAGTAVSGGTDTLTAFRRVITGAGNDTVVGTSASEVLTAGAGVDIVSAGPGADIVEGGPGNDVLRGGHGQDTIIGGPDIDMAQYDERTASEPISVTLLSPGDDGAAGENDTLTGIEDVLGGASSDVLAGDDGPNTLIGGGGLNTIDGLGGDDVLRGAEARDVITGGSGRDQLYGEGDDDSLGAADGEADVVSCGPSADDDAQVDPVDQVDGCEFSRRSDVPVPVDNDKDGFIAGFDCNDNNASIRPGATEIVEDGVDQNCDGFEELVPYVDFNLEVTFAQPTKAQLRAKKRGRRISRFVISELTPRSVVRVACSLTKATKRRSPRACPFTSKTRKLMGRASQANLRSLFRGRFLPPGTTIELRVTAPGFNGKVRRFTVRRREVRDTSLCIRTGKTRPSRCPEDEE